MGSGPPPEIELIRDYQGGSTTSRLRLDLNLTLTSEEYDDLQDHFDNGRLAEACDLILAKQAWDAATEKLIKVAVNPAAFDVTSSQQQSQTGSPNLTTRAAQNLRRMPSNAPRSPSAVRREFRIGPGTWQAVAPPPPDPWIREFLGCARAGQGPRPRDRLAATDRPPDQTGSSGWTTTSGSLDGPVISSTLGGPIEIPVRTADGW